MDIYIISSLALMAKTTNIFVKVFLVENMVSFFWMIFKIELLFCGVVYKKLSLFSKAVI